MGIQYKRTIAVFFLIIIPIGYYIYLLPGNRPKPGANLHFGVAIQKQMLEAMFPETEFTNKCEATYTDPQGRAYTFRQAILGYFTGGPDPDILIVVIGPPIEEYPSMPGDQQSSAYLAVFDETGHSLLSAVCGPGTLVGDAETFHGDSRSYALCLVTVENGQYAPDRGGLWGLDASGAWSVVWPREPLSLSNYAVEVRHYGLLLCETTPEGEPGISPEGADRPVKCRELIWNEVKETFEEPPQ